MAKSKDLFDDQTMTFGEHLDALRVHLIKSIIGLFICVCFTLYYGDSVVALVRLPIDDALMRHGLGDDLQDDVQPGSFTFMWNYFFGPDEEKKPKEDDAADLDGKTDGSVDTGKKPVDGNVDSKVADPTKPTAPTSSKDAAAQKKIDAEAKTSEQQARQTIVVEFSPSKLAKELHEHDDRFPAPTKIENETPIKLEITAPEFSQFKNAVERQNQAVTLTVQEAFMTYLKVGIVSGLAIASPWIFYQLWLFVAAGLYPHERKYVYIYLPMSIFLFSLGAVFCFIAVFPFVLDFLLGFNKMLDVQPQIRLSEWISFAIMLPMMFGLSFQLPMVMLFLERISIIEVKGYREKRRMAILIIAFLSMMLTPADPMSMLLMMFPLMILYELGILLCAFKPSKAGFPDEPQAA